jgi:hypothetical protein
MKFDAETLYSLLPAVLRTSDQQQGGALRELVAVIAEQVAALEEDLAQLYADQFIETCAEWVVPYLGDLVGYRALYADYSRTGSQQAEVANTIAYRRRKGTASMLEQLAQDVTGWNANVVEFFQRLATSQHLNHVRLDHPITPDLRRWTDIERFATPFDPFAHTAEVRWVSSQRGRYNIPNVGIFLWRIASHRLSDSPTVQLDAQRFLFNPLGANQPLYNQPELEETITHLALPQNVPHPLSRRELHANLARHYGIENSLWLRLGGQLIGIDQIQVCDLSDLGADPQTSSWATPGGNKIAIDPQLGRIFFPQPVAQPVQAGYHYGFSAEIGGGEYFRQNSFTTLGGVPLRVPADKPNLQAALQDFHAGVVEITDNGRYTQPVVIQVASNQRLEVRAAEQRRSHLQLAAPLVASGADSGEVTLNGLLISGAPLQVPESFGGNPNRLQTLRLVHCTLVPGLTLKRSGEPAQPGTASLEVFCQATKVIIEKCILGGLRVAQGVDVEIYDSLVDATAEGLVAFAAADGAAAGGSLQVANSTVIGKVNARQFGTISNAIFLAALNDNDSWDAPLRVDRLQEGCVRFSYLPPGVRTPRRYHCQPEDEAQDNLVRPQFTSLRYAQPGYGQLSLACAAQILHGADDEAEMGAYHHLFQPQRETNLRLRLNEYLRFGLEAGIFYAS